MKKFVEQSISVFSTAVIVISVAYLLMASRSTNDGAWASLRVIDAHAHIGSFAGYDLSTPTLLRNIESFGVERALISNIDGSNLPGVTKNLSEKTANEITIKVVKEHPKILRGILWTRPADGDPELIESLLNNSEDTDGKPIFVALKFHPEFNQVFADNEKLDPYMEICDRHKIPAVFHCGGARSYSSPERIYTLAKRYPHVATVLYHMGFGTDHTAAIKVAKEAKDKGDALIYLETAQAAPGGVLDAINQLGSTYVLFGTDATYFGTQHYQQYQPQIDMLKKHLSKDDLDNVLHKNAERLFHI